MKLLILGILLAGCSFAQTKQAHEVAVESPQATIDVGVNLHLGMSRDAVIAQLAANYKVQKLSGEGDDWFVAEKESPATWIGTLGFQEGKLTYASRLWTQGQEDNYEFAQAFRGAMAQMANENKHICSFDVPTSRSPIAEIESVRFYCGEKRIGITATNVLNGTTKGHQVQIEESPEFRRE